MGLPVLILGESGSGKSASLREFSPEEISIFNVAGKPLPFKKRLATMRTHDYTTIKAGMLKSEKNAFVIDDSQYLLCFELFDRADSVFSTYQAGENGFFCRTDTVIHWPE